MSNVDYLGEGQGDENVAERMILDAGHELGTSYFRPWSGTGKQNVDSRLGGLNAGTRFGNPVLVIRDLDLDRPCAPELVQQLLPDRHPHLLLRVAVRETESWMMSDRDRYADFIGARLRDIPVEPDELPDPKTYVVGLADRGKAPKLAAHLKQTRKISIPDWRAMGTWHADFVRDEWNVRAACANSASLAKAMRALRALPR